VLPAGLKPLQETDANLFAAPPHDLARHPTIVLGDKREVVGAFVGVPQGKASPAMRPVEDHADQPRFAFVGDDIGGVQRFSPWELALFCNSWLAS